MLWMQALLLPLAVNLPGIFLLPAAQKLAATTPTISVAAFWRLR
jgi:hypothetical protein